MTSYLDCKLINAVTLTILIQRHTLYRNKLQK
uniref:Uncharacterized protein n=1 Tax=Anguilla anguilla TaxID=7936 RepID=A0A0E9U5Y1_ANGAN